MVIHKLVQSGCINSNQISIMILIDSYSKGCWLSASEFCEKLHFNRKTFFKNIKYLLDNKLVLCRKRYGTRSYYWINSKEQQEWYVKQTKQTSTEIDTGKSDTSTEIDTGVSQNRYGTSTEIDTA